MRQWAIHRVFEEIADDIIDVVSSSMKKLHIFVCHYTKIKRRQDHIRNEFKMIGDRVVFEFIDDFDKELITEKIKLKYFMDDRDEWIRRSQIYQVKDNYRSLSIEEMSVALKHYRALKRIQELGLEYALVIEDDCIFRDDFVSLLEWAMKKLPSDWDIYYPNGFRGIYSLYNQILDKLINYMLHTSPWFAKFFLRRYKKRKTKFNPKYILADHPATMGAYSYIIRGRCVDQMIDLIEREKMVLPIDWEYSWIIYRLNLKVYFASSRKDSLISVGLQKSTIRN